MSNFSEEYRDAKIGYNVENNEWSIQINNNFLTPRKSLALARKAVDDTFKEEDKFVRHPALLVDTSGVHPCIITSYCSEEDSSRYSRNTGHRDVWISKAKGGREKSSTERLREDTAANRELIRQMEEARKQENHFSSLRYALLEKLSKYTLRIPKTPTP